MGEGKQKDVEKSTDTKGEEPIQKDVSKKPKKKAKRSDTKSIQSTHTKSEYEDTTPIMETLELEQEDLEENDMNKFLEEQTGLEVKKVITETIAKDNMELKDKNQSPEVPNKVNEIKTTTIKKAQETNNLIEEQKNIEDRATSEQDKKTHETSEEKKIIGEKKASELEEASSILNEIEKKKDTEAHKDINLMEDQDRKK